MFLLGDVGYKFGLSLLARVNSVYTRLFWVHIWVESWVVMFWHECSVFTLGCVGYKFRLSHFGTSDKCLYWVVFGTRLG